MREGGFGFCGAAGQDHHCAPPHGWMRLHLHMARCGYASRCNTVLWAMVVAECNRFAVTIMLFICVWSMQFLSFAVEWDISIVMIITSIVMIITTFNKTGGM